MITWPFAGIEANVSRLREGYRLAARIVAEAKVSSDPDGVATAEALSDGELDQLIATQHRAFYHGVGTCAMGTDPASAVVDPHCRLHGTDNVYVVDASIAPSVPRSNTNLLATAIAERALAFLGS
jgi:choline dehydrogenase